ncbi:MAG TPA: hypothetical protein VGO07_05595, partial [Candidatus Saccharimonadales bacterium]|nr:hypothetical protein [Candidatus Saccharimonadales bacterium]
SQADIIIAHSGGCFVLDPRPEQRIIMIGVPYWPDRSIFKSLCIKIASDFYHHHHQGELVFWLHKTGWNAVYSLKIRTHFRMLRGRARGAHWQYKNVTVARNIHDAMCTPDLSRLPFTTPQNFVELPGHHDECWVDPNPVVELVQVTAPLAADSSTI